MTTVEVPAASASTRAEPVVEPEPAAPAPPAPPANETELELAPGKRCTLVWDAGMFESHDEQWVIAGIGRIATKAGDVCREGVLWDLSRGIGSECEGQPDVSACVDEKFIESLGGGALVKPGAPEPQEHTGMDWVDMNFDGYRDLCVQQMMGAYNYSQLCWLFRPEKGVFERYPKLDELIWATFDAAHQRIQQGMRVGGPAYMSQLLAWEAGELIVLELTETTLGQKPDGSPLPAGFDSWEVRWQRRGGKLVKRREGPTKSP